MSNPPRPRPAASATENGSAGEPYEMLKQAIIGGAFQPGQQLVEIALAEWCGVSRTPIREALRRLQQDGLVERTHRGMTVKERSPEEILDIYDTRLVLEGFAARTAAERRTSHDLRHMRQWLEHGDTVTPESPGLVEANLGFHAAVWRATHNKSLIDVLDRLNLHLARYPETTLGVAGRWAEARHQHRELVDAIEAREGDRAQELASEHFAKARDIRLNLVEQMSVGIHPPGLVSRAAPRMS